MIDAAGLRVMKAIADEGSFTAAATSLGYTQPAISQMVRRLEQRGAIAGYVARIDPGTAGLPLSAFISIQAIDPAAPDDAPERLRHLAAIEACHSVAGDESYILQVRVAGPGDLEQLLQEIRAAAGVSTRTTVVLSTPWEGRTPPLAPPG